MALKVSLRQEEKSIPVGMTAESGTEVRIGLEAVKVENREHGSLLHRDAPDQHPMGAISELEETLEEVPMREFTALELSKIIF